MFIQSLLQTCSDRGITLSFDPEKGLHVQSPQGALTEALRAELKHHKPDIIHFLKSPQKLVASVATVGLPVDSVPRLATLATDEQGTFKNRRLFWCWLLCKAKIIY